MKLHEPLLTTEPPLPEFTNLAGFQTGSGPNDYYNGVPAVITVIVGGEGSPGPDGLLQVLITNVDGQPLTDATMTFSITAGMSKLAASADSTAALVDTRPFLTKTFFAFPSQTSIPFTPPEIWNYPS